MEDSVIATAATDGHLAADAAVRTSGGIIADEFKPKNEEFVSCYACPVVDLGEPDVEREVIAALRLN